MPEGHTIHRLARDHRRLFKGAPVQVTSPQGRFTAAATLLDGRVLRHVLPYGKHLWYDFGGGDLVHVHLGLFGKFTPHREPVVPGPNVRMRLANAGALVDLTGPTACELVGPDDRDALLARLGPDPLHKDADPDRAWRAMQRRRSMTIGAALMDQSVLAGVGNVYRAEVLHVHGIHPERPASAITRDEFDAMWASLVEWMNHGVRDNVIITVDPAEVGKPRRRIVKGEALWVYRQPACRRCGREIRRWDLAGRWAYACPSCQPA